MLFAAMTFWLVTAVLSAWGVQQLWRGMVAPRVVNAVLLPGTLVAQLGHVLGLLITGATVNNATLYIYHGPGATVEVWSQVVVTRLEQITHALVGRGCEI